MRYLKKDGIKIELDLKDELKNFDKEQQYTIPIFIPHKGCKNECVFCNQRTISGTLVVPKPNEIDKKIKEYLGYIKDKRNDKKVEIAFFGGSFTGLDIKEQNQYLEVANKYIKSGEVDSIRISTRPDYIDMPIVSNLKKYGVGTIELGVQSMDGSVLMASKRGHTTSDVIRASRLIKLFNIKLGHQIMIGLPKSNKSIDIETAKQIVRIAPNEIRIYPVYVIKGSELYDLYIKGRYTPISFEEAIERTLEVVRIINRTNIKIIRLGLQSTEEITAKNVDIVGPICDNFAEYVMCELVKEKMEKEIISRNIKKDRKVIFVVPKKYISVTVGPKKVNKIYFEEKYNIKMGVKEL